MASAANRYQSPESIEAAPFNAAMADAGQRDCKAADRAEQSTWLASPDRTHGPVIADIFVRGQRASAHLVPSMTAAKLAENRTIMDTERSGKAAGAAARVTGGRRPWRHPMAVA